MFQKGLGKAKPNRSTESQGSNTSKGNGGAAGSRDNGTHGKSKASGSSTNHPPAVVEVEEEYDFL